MIIDNDCVSRKEAVTVWVYTFEDGSFLQLLQNALSVEEVKALETIRGKSSITYETFKGVET